MDDAECVRSHSASGCVPSRRPIGFVVSRYRDVRAPPGSGSRNRREDRHRGGNSDLGRACRDAVGTQPAPFRLEGCGPNQGFWESTHPTDSLTRHFRDLCTCRFLLFPSSFVVVSQKPRLYVACACVWFAATSALFCAMRWWVRVPFAQR